MSPPPPDTGTDTDSPAERVLKWIDMTATERHISRSLRIRRKIMKYLATNVGQAFEDLSDLGNQAANYAGCSSETATRWIKQFTSPGTPFILTEQPAGYVVWRRPGREEA